MLLLILCIGIATIAAGFAAQWFFLVTKDFWDMLDVWVAASPEFLILMAIVCIPSAILVIYMLYRAVKMWGRG